MSEVMLSISLPSPVYKRNVINVYNAEHTHNTHNAIITLLNNYIIYVVSQMLRLKYNYPF